MMILGVDSAHENITNLINLRLSVIFNSGMIREF